MNVPRLGEVTAGSFGGMAESISRRLARSIRKRREELRLTQEQAAERSGLSVRYWRAIESGRPALRVEVLTGVLTGLGWGWHELADKLEPREGVVPATLGRQLEAAWRRGTPRERQVLLLLVGQLARR